MGIDRVDKKRIAAGLTELRKSRYRSRKRMAEELGMAPSRYAEFEQGRVSLPYEVAWQIADIMGCPMDYIGGRKPPEPPVFDKHAGNRGQFGSPGSPRYGATDHSLGSPSRVLAERISRLPDDKRQALIDFLSFQESQVEEPGRIRGDEDGRQSRASAS